MLVNWNDVKGNFVWRKGYVDSILSENLSVGEKIRRLSVNPYTNLNIVDYMLEYGKEIKFLFDPKELEDEYGDDFFDFFNEEYYLLNFSAIKNLLNGKTDNVDSDLLKKGQHAVYIFDTISDLYDKMREIGLGDEIDEAFDEGEFVEGLCSFYDNAIKYFQRCAEYEYGNNKKMRDKYLNQQKQTLIEKIGFINDSVNKKFQEHVNQVKETENFETQGEEEPKEKPLQENKAKKTEKKEKKEVKNKEDGVVFKKEKHKIASKLISGSFYHVVKYGMVVLWSFLFSMWLPQYTNITNWVVFGFWALCTLITIIDWLIAVLKFSVYKNFTIDSRFIKGLSYNDGVKFVKKFTAKSIANALKEILKPLIIGLICYAIISGVACVLAMYIPVIKAIYDFAIMDLIIVVPVFVLMFIIALLGILFAHANRKKAQIKVEETTRLYFWRKCPKCEGLLVHEILEKHVEYGQVIGHTKGTYVSDTHKNVYYVNGERVEVTSGSGGHYEGGEEIRETFLIAKLREICQQCGSLNIIERDISDQAKKYETMKSQKEIEQEKSQKEEKDHKDRETAERHRKI